MMLLRKIAAHLPVSWDRALRRVNQRRQIRRGTFETWEPEYHLLEQFTAEGDWVIDVGANVGYYTKKFSDIVGPRGRVIAIEPVPDTFAFLASNVLLFRHRNITLINVAVSDSAAIARMNVPVDAAGLKDYFGAAITDAESGFSVQTLALDTLDLPQRIAVLKIDTEGHDDAVLSGAFALLERDHPTLIVEEPSDAMAQRLLQLEYTRETVPGSYNALFRWHPATQLRL
ncbi:MAG: FkbM family methyltransferase [Bacteroidetes bacterium]|nr:FkbM family methyltransferase [Bacteroidota bacterium]